MILGQYVLAFLVAITDSEVDGFEATVVAETRVDAMLQQEQETLDGTVTGSCVQGSVTTLVLFIP
jgi:hypothetical protein